MSPIDWLVNPSLSPALPPRPRWAAGPWAARAAIGAAAVIALTGSCSPPPVIMATDMGTGGPSDVGENLDPRSVFDAQVKSILVSRCQVCHKTPQMGADTFLAVGDEYNSITTYRNGKFLTQDVGQSPLLTYPIGQPHPGIQFEPEHVKLVRAWLENEMAVRGTKTATPATPSVPMRDGDFFISLERLTRDPLAKITFKAQIMAGNLVAISGLQVTAGNLVDISIKKPAFIIITQGGVQKDPGDSLAGNSLTIPKGQTLALNPSSLFLTRVPGTARIALIFDSVTTTPATAPPLDSNSGCKKPDNFNSGVRPLLLGCATVCHSPKATSAPAALATNAYDMAGVLEGASAADAQIACARALARTNVAAPARSVLVLQATPQAQGGTPNHLYKVGSFADFRDAVSAWAAAEK